MISKSWFVVLSRYSRPSKFLLREQVLIWNKDQVSSYLELIKLSRSVWFDSIDKSLNSLNNKARFDGGFSDTLELTLINGFILFLERNALKPWLFMFPNGN